MKKISVLSDQLSVESWRGRFDELVYKLYTLNDNETKTVEESTVKVR